MSQLSFNSSRIRNLTDTTNTIWIRESHILNINCVINRITSLDQVLKMHSSDNDIKVNLKSLLSSQVHCIYDMQNSEKILREQENRVINKYYMVKTDIHFQKTFILKLLEGTLNNFKRQTKFFFIFIRLLNTYAQNELKKQSTDLKREIDLLKSEIRSTVQIREFILSDILNYLVNFSRNRFELALIYMEQMMSTAYLSISEKGRNLVLKTVPIHSMAQRSTSNTPVANSRPKTSTKKEVEKDENEKLQQITQSTIQSPCQNSSKKMFLVKRIEISKSIQEMSSSPSKIMITPHIYSEYNKRYGNESDRIEENLRVKENQETLERKSKLRNSIVEMNTKKPEELYSHYYNHKIQNLNEKMILRNYNEVNDTHTNLSYYQDMNFELKMLNESDQKTLIFKLFKEMQRQNAQIIVGIDNYRKNYYSFLHRQSQPEKSNSVEKSNNTKKLSRPWLNSNCKQQKIVIQNIWMNLYKNLKVSNQNLIKSVLDFKEINKLTQMMEKIKKPQTKESASARLQSQPAETITTERKGKTKATRNLHQQDSEEIRMNYYDKSVELKEQFYSPKLRCDVKVLNCQQYDYFNL